MCVYAAVVVAANESDVQLIGRHGLRSLSFRMTDVLSMRTCLTLVHAVSHASLAPFTTHRLAARARNMAKNLRKKIFKRRLLLKGGRQKWREGEDGECRKK